MPSKIIQMKINRNREALKYLRSLGFSMPKIRCSLLDMNDVKIAKLARKHGMPASTIYGVRNGSRATPAAQRITADALNLDVSELYPEETNG